MIVKIVMTIGMLIAFNACANDMVRVKKERIVMPPLPQKSGEHDSVTHVKSVKWHKLKSLKDYSADAYTLKEGVEYLEIRAYTRAMQSKVYSEKYIVTVKLGKTALKSFDTEVVEKFKASSPNLNKKTNIRKYGFCAMEGCTSYISNGFMIDKNRKIWRMNEVSDIIKTLGDIDTPAEAKLVLWLHDKNRGLADENHKDKYRKTPKGYTIISEYDNSMDNFGECGHFTYRIDISKQGKITQKKLLKKRASVNGCFTAD